MNFFKTTLIFVNASWNNDVWKNLKTRPRQFFAIRGDGKAIMEHSRKSGEAKINEFQYDADIY